jgi:hypothetical protein
MLTRRRRVRVRGGRPSRLLRRGGGPGVAEGRDYLLGEAVEVCELGVERGAEGVAQMTRSRPG